MHDLLYITMAHLTTFTKYIVDLRLQVSSRLHSLSRVQHSESAHVWYRASLSSGGHPSSASPPPLLRDAASPGVGENSRLFLRLFLDPDSIGGSGCGFGADKLRHEAESHSRNGQEPPPRPADRGEGV